MKLKDYEIKVIAPYLLEEPICSECDHCQRMLNLGNRQISYKCYGYLMSANGVEMKEYITDNEILPETSPMWCPRRINREKYKGMY